MTRSRRDLARPGCTQRSLGAGQPAVQSKFFIALMCTSAACGRPTQAPNLSAARAFAFAASSSRFFGGALVSSERRRRVEIPAISSTAARNEASFAFDGLLKPLIFLTNWREADRTSSAVTGGSKLKRVLIFLHMSVGSISSNSMTFFPHGPGTTSLASAQYDTGEPPSKISRYNLHFASDI